MSTGAMLAPGMGVCCADLRHQLLKCGARLIDRRLLDGGRHLAAAH